MARVDLTVVSHEDLVIVAATMRQADREEVLASGGFTPEEALVEAVRWSEFSRTARFDGQPACMFGVAPGVPAIPWVLTTTVVNRYPVTFWRASKTVLRAIVGLYPQLEQRIDARHVAALSWVRRLGFQVESVEPWGHARLPFHRISFGVNHV